MLKLLGVIALLLVIIFARVSYASKLVICNDVNNEFVDRFNAAVASGKAGKNAEALALYNKVFSPLADWSGQVKMDTFLRYLF